MSSVVHITSTFQPSKFFSNDIERLARVAEKAEIAWANCIVSEVRPAAEAIAARFGFNTNLVKKALEGRYSSFVDNETQGAMMLPSIQVKKKQVNIYPVLVLLREGLIVTIQDRHITRFSNFARYSETHLKKIHAGWSRSDKLTSILLRLIDENNERNYSGISELAVDIDRLGKLLADQELGFTKIANATYEMKHSVSVFLSALWENYNTLRHLNHGDVQLLSVRPEILDRFTRLIDENSWYIQLGENLTLILGSGSEAMQDYYNIHLLRFNNILSFVSTWLSVLGTMFLVPNTIATAMGNTAFELGPQDAAWYSIMLVAVTLASCGMVYFAVRKFWKLTMDMAMQKARMRTSLALSSRDGGSRDLMKRFRMSVTEK